MRNTDLLTYCSRARMRVSKRRNRNVPPSTRPNAQLRAASKGPTGYARCAGPRADERRAFPGGYAGRRCVASRSPASTSRRLANQGSARFSACGGRRGLNALRP